MSHLVGEFSGGNSLGRTVAARSFVRRAAKVGNPPILLKNNVLLAQKVRCQTGRECLGDRTRVELGLSQSMK